MLWCRRRDRAREFDWSPYQEAPAPPMTAELREACRRAFHIVANDGRVLRAGRAGLFILERIGFPVRPLGWPPLVWMVEAGYWMIANNRTAFSRWFFTDP